MHDTIGRRFDALIAAGQTHLSRIPRNPIDPSEPEFWIPRNQLAEYQQWIASASNLLKVVARKGSHYYSEPDRLMARKNDQDGIPSSRFAELLGTLTSAREEWGHGFLREIEYVVAAATFDDFLDHAAAFHRGGKKLEASVLVSVVLEDSMKRLATKYGVSSSGSLEPLVDRLVDADVFTPVKAKRIKAYAGLRNRALHAQWDQFDLKDVGEAIEGVRELVEDYL